ncbi:hypothetical protein [Schinkia azotoformans]|uniref:hypothetical protein n=1 Tax=Schinkia azotoformans TaxID=1454 RepID=UPI002DB62895|nr:hypothetical protein [Schinkia azotoformans]MEC1768313.1 hypothetical protein [Schinkia azotoformans]
MFVVRGLDGTIFTSCKIGSEGKEQTFNSEADAMLFVDDITFCFPSMKLEIIAI